MSKDHQKQKRSKLTPPANANPPTKRPASGLACLLIACAIAWCVAFSIFFFQFDLPNSSPRVNRGLLFENLPWLLLDAVDPPEPMRPDVPTAESVAQWEESRVIWSRSGWAYFPQRLGFLGVMAWILAGAWGAGGLTFRWLRPALDPTGWERTVLVLATGIAELSLLTLGCGLAGLLNRWLLGGLLVAFFLCEFFCRWRERSPGRDLLVARVKSLPWLAVFASLPFLLCMLFGALLPEVDFDVKEYHFGGPKEWYQNDRITFLPHNVYTSFPFLTEMITLLGMVLYGDWYWGAVAGKGVLMTFAPLTALGLYAAGKRWFSAEAGAFAAIIHLSTPWIYRISIIAYAEGGLTFYLFAALLAGMLLIERLRDAPDGNATANVRGLAILTGFLAGSGMACKYPGVISVVFPLGVGVTIAAWMFPMRWPRWQTAAKVAGVFSVGVMLAIGPWLAKNLIMTGNPVYPLLYSVFGGIDWDPAMDAKWKHAHSPDHHQLSDLGVKFIDVTLKSDWLSPLLFSLAPLALLATGRRRTSGWLWVYVAWLFLTWWGLTHRIDRFWVPMIPVVALLAGIGATWSASNMWRIPLRGFVAIIWLFNLAFVTTKLCGYNAYLLDLTVAEQQTAEISAPEIAMMNVSLPANSKVLCVGEAEVFDARFPVVYNTVFDESLLEAWCKLPTNSNPTDRMRSAEEIREKFREQGITHLFVNWQEILRYRATYGYTDFVSPERLTALREMGLLENPWTESGWQPLERLNDDERAEIVDWGRGLISVREGKPGYTTFLVFPIKGESHAVGP